MRIPRSEPTKEWVTKETLAERIGMSAATLSLALREAGAPRPVATYRSAFLYSLADGQAWHEGREEAKLARREERKERTRARNEKDRQEKAQSRQKRKASGERAPLTRPYDDPGVRQRRLMREARRVVDNQRPDLTKPAMRGVIRQMQHPGKGVSVLLTCDHVVQRSGLTTKTVLKCPVCSLVQKVERTSAVKKAFAAIEEQVAE